MLAPQVPWPPTQGTAIRNFHVAREVAARHALTIVAFGDEVRADDPLREAGARIVAVPPPPPRPMGRRLAEVALQRDPDLARRLQSAAMDRALVRVVREMEAEGGIDVVQIEGLEMAGHGLAAARSVRAGRPRVVYDAHNAEWLLQDRAWRADIRRMRAWHGALYSIAQTIKLRRFERRLLAAADAVVAVSAADARTLRALVPGKAVTIVPNGVDTAHYAPADPALAEPGLCVFTGKMDFRPNVDAVTWLARHVWPRVVAARADARLEIVGRDPVPRVLGLADAAIAVTGAVPDVRPHIRRASVVLAPLRVGGGTRLKVLEAMAMARPVAATSLGVEGLDVTPGRDVLVGDAPAHLAAAVGRLLGEPELRVAVGGAARETAVARYRWETLVPRIERLYAKDDA